MQIRQIIEGCIEGNVLKMEAIGLRKLPEEILEYPHIERVLLANNSFTMVPPILAKMEKVSYLDLSNNIFTTLNATLQNMKNLRHLVLRYPLYGTSDFNRLLKLKQLERLDLMFFGFDPGMMQTLQKALPNCKISYL